MKTQALVTLTIGERYRSLWHSYARDTWLSYATRHDLDVVVLDRPLDTSRRARERSPAWQKLLVLSQDFARNYERLVWVDSDIVMNPAAPLVTHGIPPERVGAVDEAILPSRSEHSIAIARLARTHGIPPEHQNTTPERYYEAWGLPSGFPAIVQSGVLILSPAHHREILEHVYHAYEDRGSPMWHYEMRPLSYELMQARLVDWIDSRFNSLWAYVKAVHYPWLLGQHHAVLRRIRGMRRIPMRLEERMLRQPVRTALTNCYWLHFASYPHDMRTLRGVESDGLSALALRGSFDSACGG